MTIPHLIPIAEAAAFTLGCAVIGSRRFDPQRLGAALACATVALLLILLIASLPYSPQAGLADPDGARNFLN
ncbi:hypothetical protein [Methylorubrum zatmanii]|uniref:Uncharacterized protein n=1 Tax=Methylorubrum zatmanii TaxID=29429 RepID=A0ABW1WU59_9HYPH|nr:hypothetical protein [Methylorubrum zatmanii]MBD8906116.1 hypothetical protein [Methylorubrum zatmanii]